MDTKTGEIFEGTDEELKAIEAERGRKLTPLSKADAKELRSIPESERVAYFKRITKNRKKSKAARAARRKQRK